MKAKIMGALLAGATPAALHAQQTTVPEPPAAPAAPPAAAPPGTPAAPPGGAPPATMEFRGPDGKPLPADIQAQLRERIRNGTLTPGATVGMPAGTGNAPAGGGEIVVSGQRQRGAVLGDIPPERTFNPVDIRALGANSIEELIQTLGPQAGSGRGRDDAGPVVLLNGRRVSSFAEIARIPTEAIERMDILPEEVALKYGFRADRKVVNVVAFERFSSHVGQFVGAAPTEGGRDTVGASAGLLRIQGETRMNLDADYSRSGKLTESERDVRQVDGGTELGRFRTLLPSTERLVLGGTASTPILSDATATLNGRFEANASEALLGLGANGVLARDTDTRVAHLGTTLGGRAGGWQWSLTGNYDRTRTDTATDVAAPGLPRDTARAVNTLADADLLVSGPLLNLPAGPVSTSVRVGGDLRDFASRSVVAGIARAADLSRNRGTVQGNLDLPIAGTATPALAWLGSLSANANVAVERLSDFGTLTTVGYGLAWTPIAAINLLASVTLEEGAPTVEQLGAPLIVTPNVRTFDFTRGETVDITRIVGGNPALRADDRRVVSLGLTAKPFGNTDLTLTLDYLRTRIDDPIAFFPVATPAIEAAFPERFGRAADGRLARIDGTPVNFARSDQEQLRWGINFLRPLGPVPPNLRMRFASSPADAQRRLPPGAQVTRIEPGTPAYRRYENLTSRLILGVQHTWRLEDRILLRPGGPVLDLLDGGALDLRGGRPRHEVEIQAGAFKRGLGARVTANWQSATRVDGLAGADGAVGDLDFGSFATVNLNLFANPGDYLGRSRAPAWLRGTRISLGVANLFNTRPQVRDAAGATPINYQSAYLNPVGRLVSLGLRKVF